MALHRMDQSHKHKINVRVLDQRCCASETTVSRNISITNLQHGLLHRILPSVRESSKNPSLLHQCLSFNYTHTITNYPTKFASSDWTGQERDKLGVKLDVTILGWYARDHIVVHTTPKSCEACLIEPLVAFPTVSLYGHWRGKSRIALIASTHSGALRVLCSL
jgi:hypothetical protein